MRIFSAALSFACKCVLGETCFFTLILFCASCGNAGTSPKQNSEDGVRAIRIGAHVWSANNLNVDTFANGDSIPEARTAEEWIRAGESKQPAWCYYENDSAQAETYGRMYNWYAVADPRGLAPKGWHVSTKNEWESLMKYAGGTNLAGDKLKSRRFWDNDGNGTDEYGFAGFPSGERHVDGEFSARGSLTAWWTSSKQDPEYAWNSVIYYFNGFLQMNYVNTSGGGAVRCVKDEK